jgi:glucokinase
MRGGIDLGGTKIEAVVVDDDDLVTGQARRVTPTDGGPAAVAAEMVAALREAAAAAHTEPERLSGVGVGSPGEVDTRTGTVARASNLPDWQEPFALGSALAAELGTRVRVGNDVAVAVEAEAALGAGSSYRSFIGIWWGTGVGGAVFLNRKRWRGRGSAGEIGHTVVKLNGARCLCGRRGCLEAYAGRSAMERRALRATKRGDKTVLFKLMRKKGHARLTSGIWEEAVHRGDDLAVQLIDRAIEALGAAAASTINLLDLEAVIIGGGLGSRFGDEAAARIATEMTPHLLRPDQPPAVHTAKLGDQAGGVGAARLFHSAQAERVGKQT